jgi:hypothetical protein
MELARLLLEYRQEVGKMRLHNLAAGVLLLVGGATFAGANDVAIQVRLGTREQPLTGRRYQTMRALAHYLDERAQNAADQARSTGSYANWRYWNERRFLVSIRRFAGKAHDFHQRMDGYETRPWDLPGEVQQLQSDAQTVNNRIRHARAFQDTWQSWDAVLDVIGRMDRVLAGYEVSVPPAHRPDWGDSRRDYGPWAQGGRGGSGGYDRSNDDLLDVGELREFRRLADRLEQQAIRAREDADRVRDTSARNAVVSRDVSQFTEQARALQDKSQSTSLETRDVGAAVSQLLDDARRTDRSLRSTGDFAAVWPTWSQVIRTLEQMDTLVRS